MTQDMNEYFKRAIERLEKAIENPLDDFDTTLEKLLAFRGEKPESILSSNDGYHVNFENKGFIIQNGKGEIPKGESIFSGAFYEHDSYLLLFYENKHPHIITGRGVEFT